MGISRCRRNCLLYQDYQAIQWVLATMPKWRGFDPGFSPSASSPIFCRFFRGSVRIPQSLPWQPVGLGFSAAGQIGSGTVAAAAVRL